MIATPFTLYRGPMAEPTHPANKVKWLGVRDTARRLGIPLSTAVYWINTAEEEDAGLVWRPKPRTVLIDEARFIIWYANKNPEWKDPQG